MDFTYQSASGAIQGHHGPLVIITVAALKLNETLKELSLGDNKFMPTDGVHIGNLLKYNHKIELLDLRNNNLQVRR